MLIRNLRRIRINYNKNRCLHTSTLLNENNKEHPFWRTLRILGEDLQFKKRRSPVTREDYALVASRSFPRHADVVIIGGGAIGSSIAYWLKLKSNFDGIRVVVIDKDFTYKKCATAISLGCLKQQFSIPENIQMAAYGAEFIRKLKDEIREGANVNFEPAGYLSLASNEGAEQLVDNIKLQTECGCINMMLTPEQIKQKFPYLNVSDVAVGCLGVEKEGWFNAWDLLNLIRNKSVELGAEYVEGEVQDFVFKQTDDIIIDGVEPGNYVGTNELVVKLKNEKEPRNMEFSICIVAAGHESRNISQLARIGVDTGMLSVSLPIEKRKRFVYSFTCENHPPSINSPVIEDYTGLNVRREGLGGDFLVGVAPYPEYTPSTDSEADKKKFFDELVLPNLKHRIPAFKDVKVNGSWSGDYDCNVYDGNGVIGVHPYYMNLYFATGFSDQGIQQAPAVGRAVSELIIDGSYRTIDLTRLGFDRFIVEKPLLQTKVT